MHIQGIDLQILSENHLEKGGKKGSSGEVTHLKRF